MLKDKILELLLKSGGYLSGEELGEKLGVSRAAVWKAIAKLKEQGYHIEAVTNKGYCLKGSSDLLNSAEIQHKLQTSIIGQKVYFFDYTTSTNDEARKLAIAGEAEGALIIAESQTAGKGRLGRQWVTLPGTGIWMSLILRPDIAPIEASRLTLLAGLCVCKAVRKCTGLEALIKWPNDVYIHNKKICGILTEMNSELDKVHFIILGIGINVNVEVFPEELRNVATSLQIEAGHPFIRKEIVQAFLEFFEKAYFQYVNKGPNADFIEEYESLCMTIGHFVHVLSRTPFDGKAVGIDKEGELIVEKENGERVVVFSGEVSIRNIE